MGSERGKGKAQGVGTKRGNAVGEFLDRGFFNFGRIGRLHQSGCAFSDQSDQCNAVDNINRVQNVAFGLRHFLAVFVAHQTGNVNMLERYLAGKMIGHHDHPGDPEENYIEAGHQHGRWQTFGVIIFRHVAFVRPAKCRVRPQRR